MNKNTKTTCLALFTLWLFTPLFATADDHAQKTQAPLERLESKEFDEVLIAPAIRLIPSRRAYVSEVPVSFAETWLEKFGASTTKRYRAHVTKKYGNALKKAIETKLQAQGWQISAKAEPGVITILPKISELDIKSPEQTGIRHTILASNAGSAVLSIEYLSSSENVIMTISDLGSTPATIGSPFANRRTNFKYFKLLLDNWAINSSTYIVTLVEQAAKSSGE